MDCRVLVCADGEGSWGADFGDLLVELAHLEKPVVLAMVSLDVEARGLMSTWPARMR